ncbi:hypothetical protein K474DRAFT_1209177 [Panus rudis PR-1116 ss-1]|nr:hypothetical protein K474DRAFT_1209177 [Panus rudis PR-1116 ss-1]
MVYTFWDCCVDCCFSTLSMMINHSFPIPLTLTYTNSAALSLFFFSGYLTRSTCGYDTHSLLVSSAPPSFSFTKPSSVPLMLTCFPQPYI